VVSSLFKIKDKLNSGKYILTPRVVRQLEMIKSLNDFDKIIVLNNWYKTVLLENQISIEKITTVKTSYKKIINVFNSELVEFQILFAGRKNTSKGLVLLLKSLKMAQFAFKVRLVICGPNDPNETKLILKLVNELKQKIQISVRDNIMHDELLKIVQKSHLVVLPSVDAEMCPLIILESQSNCIPVLGANHTGISDLIEEGKNGFLFKSSSMIDLKEKLEVLVNEKKLIHLNKILVDSKMDEFDFLEKHLVIYRQLLGN
jgi:glycosyltransferase involved in cell wall biosynthesis